ncbi:hypothetical protein VZT92_012207 [Zoarces viviparus]|uniref:Rhodanese domain-containing protein n=1 Tax=Zoarces viviparus TaxID=48416 RepID=A0AAW1F7L3_ZOAVI
MLPHISSHRAQTGVKKRQPLNISRRISRAPAPLYGGAREGSSGRSCLSLSSPPDCIRAAPSIGKGKKKVTQLDGGIRNFSPARPPTSARSASNHGAA